MSANSGLNSAKAAAALGLHRFGFGPVGDAIAAIAADPSTAFIVAKIEVSNAKSPAKTLRSVHL